MSEPIDRFQFVVDQRRKFMKEMAALTGLAMVSSAELVRAAPVSITGDDETKDMNWGSIKGRLIFDVTGRVEVLDADMATPGDGVRLSVSLQRPVACEEGSRFAIREGNRTVGSGVVTKVIE